MELSQAIALINHKKIPTTQTTTWADLGCGSGLFTNALAHLLKPGSKIFAIDKSISALKKIQLPNAIQIETIQANFITEDININNLDGILMANSLHYVKDKIALIHKLENYFKSSGCFLIVEYDTDKPNSWVPYPISFSLIKILFERVGYDSIKINELPSRYSHANIYGALILKKT